MKIYISGISGTGMGPLALMAKNAGFEVFGSDLEQGAIYSELNNSGIEISIGPQDGKFLQAKLADGIDWFVYTSALPKEHPELMLAQASGIKCSKRDDFTEFLIKKLNLKMVAVAGTHGKTTTTAMIIWAALKLRLPVSYIVGTTLGFAPSGSYQPGDKYFIYEADEYDRNFLKYHPWLAVIPAVSYDHPDIYPTKADYAKAFEQFKNQSQNIIEQLPNGTSQNNGKDCLYKPEQFKLAGEARRIDAALSAEAVTMMQNSEATQTKPSSDANSAELIDLLNQFPGVGRRFEKINHGVYSDYAHHPEEIAATVEIAQEAAKLTGKKGVIVLYQPHQNTRQHEVREGYKDAFAGVDKLYWLPTYLTREDPTLPVLTPADLIKGLSNQAIAEPAKLDDDLVKKLSKHLDDGYLVILMTAGPADTWLRKHFA